MITLDVNQKKYEAKESAQIQYPASDAEQFLNRMD